MMKPFQDNLCGGVSFPTPHERHMKYSGVLLPAYLAYLVHLDVVSDSYSSNIERASSVGCHDNVLLDRS